MKLIQNLTAAALPFMLLAAPAFAQDNMAQEVVTDAAKDAAKAAVKQKTKDVTEDVKVLSGDVTKMKDGTIKAKGDPLVLDTPNNVITATKGEMILTEEETKIYGKEIQTKPKMIKAPAMQDDTNMPSKMAPSPELVKIACPSGTTAQPNGTCMITGDYKG